MGVWAFIVLVVDVIFILQVLKSKLSSDKKLLWVVLILLLPVLGAVLWYLVGRKR